MYGKANGLYLGQSTGQTGAAAGDANGYVLKFLLSRLLIIRE
jgi:hypothetical protein